MAAIATRWRRLRVDFGRERGRRDFIPTESTGDSGERGNRGGLSRRYVRKRPYERPLAYEVIHVFPASGATARVSLPPRTP